MSARGVLPIGHQVTTTPIESAQTMRLERGWDVTPLVQAPVARLNVAPWHGHRNCEPRRLTVQQLCGHEAEYARYSPPPFDTTMMSGCPHCGSE